jgi:hypothetical protein
MTGSEREVLQEQLRLMAAGRGDGIDLDSAERWVIEGLCSPTSFFQQIEQLIPTDSIIYFEAIDPVSEASHFYESNRAFAGAVCVVRDMIFPVPEIFHVQMRPGVIDGLVRLLGKHPQERCFTHVKAYHEAKLLVEESVILLEKISRKVSL